MNNFPHVHPALRAFAEKVGVRFADRDADESYVWDGETLALYRRKYVCDEEGEVLSFSRVAFSDAELLHDVAHYLIAEPCQREFPEFGLVIGLVVHEAWGPLDGPFRDSFGNLKPFALTYGDGLVEGRDQTIQELATQMVCFSLGPRLGISAIWSDKPDDLRCQTWAAYEAFKKTEHKDYSSEVLKHARRLAYSVLAHLDSNQ